MPTDIPMDWVHKHHFQKVETEDLIFGADQLEVGMIVLTENDDRRVEVRPLYPIHPLIDLSLKDQQRARKHNRWCKIVEIRISEYESHFLGEYWDGSKFTHHQPLEGPGWYVKRDSIPNKIDHSSCVMHRDLNKGGPWRCDNQDCPKVGGKIWNYPGKKLDLDGIKKSLEAGLFEAIRASLPTGVMGKTMFDRKFIEDIVTIQLRIIHDKVSVFPKIWEDPLPTGKFDKSLLTQQLSYPPGATEVRDLLELIKNSEAKPNLKHLSRDDSPTMIVKNGYIIGDIGIGEWTVDFTEPVLRPKISGDIVIGDPNHVPLPITKFEYYMDGEIWNRDLEAGHRCNDKCKVMTFEEGSLLVDRRKAVFYHVSAEAIKAALKIKTTDSPDILSAKKDADPDLIG